MNAIELFGLNIKKLRLLRGVTQAEVGIALGGLSHAAVGKIERGVNKSLPSHEQIIALARRLDVKPEELLGADYGITERYTVREEELMAMPEATVYIKAALGRMQADIEMKKDWVNKHGKQS